MLNVGSKIKIILCQKLQEYGLLPLVGQIGVITECRFDNLSNPGAFVTITKGKNKNEEWFIPLRSLQTKELINKMKSVKILKHQVREDLI